MSSSTIFVTSSTTTTVENYQGDLTDIIRATNGPSSSSSPSPSPSHHHHHDNHNHWNTTFSSVLEDNNRGITTNNMFGDPLFSSLRDPFLQQLDHHISSSSSPYFNITTTSTTMDASSSSSASSVFALEENHEIMRSSILHSRPLSKNIFSNMIQISPNYNNNNNHSSPTPIINIKPPSSSLLVSSSNNININVKDSLLIDNNNNNSVGVGGGGTGVQISSSKNNNNNTSLKRRKNQAKKVVCIPAPAAANSRQTGEVVPSDLWAWRKYGQKPIKGSPYPRGYYRCSSSKGCSARKQVERSRTDPNMLVITYTSEHNHPWPTQRNALAGSTRSQPSKTNKGITSSHPQNDTTTKEQQNNNSEGNDSLVVKEENIMVEDIENILIQDEGEVSYKPSMIMENDSNNNNNHEDFFAELDEIEADPLNLLFNQGFVDGGGDGNSSNIIQRDQSKGVDPFHFFDWSSDNKT